MLLSSELYCEFIWGQQSIHLPTAGLPRPHFSFCMCQCAGKAGCHYWWQDRGLGCNSLPAQEAADTTAPTPSTTADQQAQIFSHLWYITSSLQLFPMQKHPNLSCSCPSPFVWQYLILKMVLRNFGLVLVKLFCTCRSLEDLDLLQCLKDWCIPEIWMGYKAIQFSYEQWTITPIFKLVQKIKI